MLAASIIASPLLALPELLYRLALRADEARARRRVARGVWPLYLPRPVLSVGNIVAGGTGKTPLVEALAREWLRRGGRPGILSRGYRGGRSGNDEYLLLRRRLPGVPHEQDPDRHRAGVRLLGTNPEVDLVILDDGFQHRALHRDVDLVVLDATSPFGGGHLLPRGRLREPWQGLRRAHHVILTRTEGASPHMLAILRTFLREQLDAVPVSEAKLVVEGIAGPAGALVDAGIHPRCAAFAGIGNPQAFFALLRRLGVPLVAERAFRDHHDYGAEDLEEIRLFGREHGADAVICTEKDGVKLERLHGFRSEGAPILELRIHFELEGADPLVRLPSPRTAT